MSETWYRGQSTALAPSQAGGAIHDFGDGMYLTSSKDVAELYARTRVQHGGGSPEVLMVRVDRASLGRVLDLGADARWQQFLREPQIPGRKDTTPENLIRLANENYGRFFTQFAKQHKIDLRGYDAVIGPEFVRGGSQLALLHKDGRPSPLANQIRGRLVPVGSAGPASSMPTIPGSFFVARGTVKGVAGNQAAMGALGAQLGVGIQKLGDYAIRKRIEEALSTTHAASIARILEGGQGVLVIVRMQEWARPDFNGQRARTLLGVLLQSGASADDALHRWRNQDQLVAGAASGWRSFEQYLWISPSR